MQKHWRNKRLLFFLPQQVNRIAEKVAIGNLMFLHILLLENEEKTSGGKIQKNVFLSTCSSYAKHLANLSKTKKKNKKRLKKI